MKNKKKSDFFELLEYKKLFWFYLAVGITFSAISIVAPTLSGELVNAVIYGQENIWMNLLWLLLAYAMLLLISVLDQYCGNLFVVKQKMGMRNRAFEAILQKGNLNREKISSFVSFTNNDIPSIVENYFQGSIDILKCTSIAVGASVALLLIHWLLAIIIVGSSLLMVFMPNVIREKAASYREAYGKALEKYNTILASYLEGADIVKAYRYHEKANKKVIAGNYEAEKEERKVRGCQLCVYGMAGSIQILKNVLVLVAGVYLIYLQEIRVGELLAAVQLAEVLASPIEVLAYLINGKNEVAPLVQSYEEIRNRTEVTSGVVIDKIETIRMEKVSVSVNELMILNDVTATFEAGKKYMLVGKCGSGKSTLLRLLGRTEYEEHTGYLQVNQSDYKQVTDESFYEKVGIVSQEPYLFWASLEENILLGRAISREVYLKVIERLKLTYLLERFSGETLDEESVSRLSGGEKQRIALARAMVGKPEVYLLDEITSSLDAENAYEIEQMLLNEDAMVIHACHKIIPELQSQYDEILSLDK